MKLLLLATLGFLAVTSVPATRAASANASANGNSSGTNNGQARTSDEEWAAVVALAMPSVAPTTPGQGRRTPARADAELRQRAQQAREASEKAKVFYTAFPAHMSAREARKLEVLMALQGVLDSDAAQESSARQIASAYRTNLANTATDRFEVAVLAERVNARARLGGSAFGNNPAELEAIADRLLVEFGDLPEAYYFYASVARAADMARAGRMADRILRTAPAPAAAKEEAQAIKARQDLLGTTLRAQLRATDARSIDLSQQAGKLTILYVWPTRTGADGMAALLPAKTSLPFDAQVIYLPLATSPEQGRALEAKRPVPGPICVGAESNSALQEICGARHFPYVYLLDRTSKLVSFGPASELTTLLLAASR